MTLDRNLPGPHPLARVNIMGTPYHGLVQGGSLPLPNETTKSYPQPDATWPDQAGSTHLLRRDGVPAVTRTEAQEALDEANGFQWRNVAMLCGGRQQLYGRDLDGWIYVAPNGTRWWIKIVTNLETEFNFSSAISLEFRVRRFGEIGLTASPSTTTLSLTDWGQQGYDILQGFTITGTGQEAITNARVMLDALAPDGSKAALCIHRRRTTSADASDSTVDVAVRHPLGWLEVEVDFVDGAPVLTMGVLKSRAETLVTVINARDAYPAVDRLPALITPGTELDVQVGSYGFEYEFERLVAVWVDPDTFEWRWVVLRSHEEGLVSTSMSVSGVTYVWDRAVDISHDVSLEVDGVAVNLLQSTYASTSQVGYQYNLVAGFGEVTTVGLDDTVEEVTIDGVDYDLTTGAGDGINWGNISLLIVPPLTNPGDTNNVAAVVIQGRIFRSMWRLPLRCVLQTPQPYRVSVDVARQSGQVLGLRMHLLSGTVSDFTYWPRQTPSGSHGSKEVRTYSASERLYGSWCPHTEQAVSMEASAVCWV